MVKFKMVNVMSIVKYPPHIADELVKYYLSGKATKYPEFVKRVNQWMASDYEYITYNIYEIPEEKLYEGMKGITKRLAAFASAFEGYKFKVNLLVPGNEALDLFKK
jgi:hypothetical protein